MLKQAHLELFVFQYMYKTPSKGTALINDIQKKMFEKEFKCKKGKIEYNKEQKCQVI
jgi:hypothetical protein